jgi:hypothetical protein
LCYGVSLFDALCVSLFGANYQSGHVVDGGDSSRGIGHQHTATGKVIGKGDTQPGWLELLHLLSGSIVDIGDPNSSRIQVQGLPARQVVGERGAAKQWVNASHILTGGIEEEINRVVVGIGQANPTPGVAICQTDSIGEGIDRCSRLTSRIVDC